MISAKVGGSYVPISAIRVKIAGAYVAAQCHIKLNGAWGLLPPGEVVPPTSGDWGLTDAALLFGDAPAPNPAITF